MEDYLECMANVVAEQGFVRAADVAERLGLRQASVSIMIKRLAELGYLNHVRYRGFTLTRTGAALAAKVRARHETLTEFFELLGLSGLNLERDVEGIEHHVSGETLALLRQFIEFWAARPEVARSYGRFLETRKSG